MGKASNHSKCINIFFVRMQQMCAVQILEISATLCASYNVQLSHSVPANYGKGAIHMSKILKLPA